MLDGAGQLLSEMTRAPTDILPLDANILARASGGRVATSAARGRSILLGFPVNGKIALVQLAADKLLGSHRLQDDLLATRNGEALALGAAWHELPSYEALALSGDKAGAAAALGKVGGSLSELAQFWLIYANRTA